MIGGFSGALSDKGERHTDTGGEGTVQTRYKHGEIGKISNGQGIQARIQVKQTGLINSINSTPGKGNNRNFSRSYLGPA